MLRIHNETTFSVVVSPFLHNLKSNIYNELEIPLKLESELEFQISNQEEGKINKLLLTSDLT